MKGRHQSLTFGPAPFTLKLQKICVSEEITHLDYSME